MYLENLSSWIVPACFIIIVLAIMIDVWQKCINFAYKIA